MSPHLIAVVWLLTRGNRHGHSQLESRPAHWRHALGNCDGSHPANYTQLCESVAVNLQVYLRKRDAPQKDMFKEALATFSLQPGIRNTPNVSQKVE